MTAHRAVILFSCSLRLYRVELSVSVFDQGYDASEVRLEVGPGEKLEAGALPLGQALTYRFEHDGELWAAQVGKDAALGVVLAAHRRHHLLHFSYDLVYMAKFGLKNNTLQNHSIAS